MIWMCGGRERERERERGRAATFEVEQRESKCDGKQLVKGDDGGVTFHKYGAR